MKIAILSMYLPSGSKIGVGYVVHYLANELVGRGHEVTVFSQTGRSDDSLYDVVVVPSGRHLRTFAFAWNLRRYDFSGFDVLNAHGDDWFLWGRKRPRHVHTFHGSLWAEMLHASGVIAKARMFALALCEYSSCFLGDVNTTVSSITKKYIPRIDCVIPNGVNLSDFSPTEDKTSHPTILFVGTMHGRKRGQMLFDLFVNEIKPRVPNAEFWAVCENEISGDGVRWFGRVPYKTLTDLYRRAWVFCLPSSYEGFGVPYIEAMASGTPVVAAPNDGAIEVTGNGAFGIVSKDEDLANNLVQVLTDNVLRESLREKGLARSKDFGWDTVCEQYLAVYRGEK